MPKIGSEPVRKKALIDAAAAMIGEQGTTEITVKQIADRAGMSSALAFHYFGDKDEIFFQTMRHLLRELGSSVAKNLRGKSSPTARMETIVECSFGEPQFDRTTIAAWLVFYMRAFSCPRTAKLHSIYVRRLRSNLLHEFRKLVSREDSRTMEQSLSALIDGLYLRHGLRPEGPDAAEAIALCKGFLERQLAAAERKS